MPKHYKIKKIVICDLSGEQCGEAYEGRNYTYTRCEYCCYYCDWKKSGMTLEEWKEKVAQEEAL